MLLLVVVSRWDLMIRAVVPAWHLDGKRYIILDLGSSGLVRWITKEVTMLLDENDLPIRFRAHYVLLQFIKVLLITFPDLGFLLIGPFVDIPAPKSEGAGCDNLVQKEVPATLTPLDVRLLIQRQDSNEEV